ncbi:MAG: class I SAM-dependent methyltransferase [Kiritimatiellia bacterium]
MKLPDCSNMMRVGQLRHIQSVCERAEYRNPDNLVRHFLTFAQRQHCLMRAALKISGLRANPFYNYIIARTKYYDELFMRAVFDNTRVIVNIGCGSDTRSYRFGRVLKQMGVRVLECDQPDAIVKKQAVARKNWPVDHVDYLSVNLDRLCWDELKRWLDGHDAGCVFVLMEGVSPYIGKDAFGQFLDFLADRLPSGSRLAYDYKLQGVDDEFGGDPQGAALFRLPENRDVVAGYHRAHGFRLDRMELSSELAMRMLPALPERSALLFREDCLLDLAADKKAAVGE